MADGIRDDRVDHGLEPACGRGTSRCSDDINLMIGQFSDYVLFSPRLANRKRCCSPTHGSGTLARYLPGSARSFALQPPQQRKTTRPVTTWRSGVPIEPR